MLPDNSMALISGYKLRYTSKNILQFTFLSEQPPNLLVIRFVKIAMSNTFLVSLILIQLFYSVNYSLYVFFLNLIRTDKQASGQDKYIIFTEKSSEIDLLWTGPKTDTAAAVQYFGADEAYTLDKLEKFLKGSGVAKERLFIESDQNSIITGHEQEIGSIGTIDTIIQTMRVIKDEEELKVMQEAADIAAEAFIQVMS